MNPTIRVRVARRLPIAIAAACVAVIPFTGVTTAGAVASHPRAVCVPTPANDSYSTPQDTALEVSEPGVTSNDTLCDTDGLVISTSSPSHGQLTGFDDSGGGFTYTPDPGFTGTDSFTYVLEDVEGSPTATVTITVTAPATTTTTAAATTTTAPATTTTAAAAQAVTASPAFTG